MKPLTPTMLSLLVGAVTNQSAISPMAHEKHRRGLEARGLIDGRGIPTKEGVEYLQRPYKQGNVQTEAQP